MIGNPKPTILAVLAIAVLLADSTLSYASATYTIEDGFTQILIQSPIPNESYNESSVRLVVEVRLIYGTSSITDEFSFRNLTISYGVDGCEWCNFTSRNITSNTAMPSVNFWQGLLHKLNITYTAELQNLTDGLHSVDVNLRTNDSWGAYENVAQANFTTRKYATPTPSISFPTPTILPTISSTQIPQPNSTLPTPPPAGSSTLSPSSSPTQQPTTYPSPMVNGFADYLLSLMIGMVIAVAAVITGAVVFLRIKSRIRK